MSYLKNIIWNKKVLTFETSHAKACFIKVHNIPSLDSVLLNCCLICSKPLNNLLFLLCCQAYNSKRLCLNLMQPILLPPSREPAEAWRFEILSALQIADCVID